MEDWLLLLGFGGFCLGFRLGLGRDGFGAGEVGPFEDRFFGGVALAGVQLDDAGVPAVAALLRWSDFVEEDFNGVFLLQEPRTREAAVVDGAALAESDHFFR